MEDNRYRIVQLLGVSARGSTFLGIDRETEREVAVKILDRDYAAQSVLEPAFKAWFSTAAQLDHPDILKYSDINLNTTGMPLYLVMELIPRGNLRQQQAHLSLAEAIQIVRQICLVLDYAHQQQIFHRAIKPENILLGEPAKGTSFPRPFLADVGLPAWTDMGLSTMRSLEPRTKRDVLPGTLKYVSPEQVKGEAPEARSDIYSLGIVLYELAVGQVPFDVKTIAQAIRQHADILPPLPRSRQPELSETLEQIILKALAKNPDERFQSAAALAEALAQVLVELPAVFSHKESPTPAQPKTTVPSTEAITSAPLVTPFFTEVSESQPSLFSIDYHVPGFLSLEPGKSSSFSLVVTNHTETAKECNLSVEGIPNDWISDLPTPIRLGPRERREIRFTLAPPRAPSSRVGRHTLIVHLRNPELPGGKLTISKPLMVGRYTQFDCELLPENKRIDAGSVAQVLIHNQGNSPETFLVRWHEASGKIRFSPARERLQLPAGERRTINFQAWPTQTLVIGHTPLIQNLERQPFSIAVSLDNESKTLNGEAITRGLVPTRFGAHFVILILLISLCVVLGQFIRPPDVESVVLNPFEPAFNQPFTISWVIGGNTWGATVDLAVDSEEVIKTGLDIDDVYVFSQGLSKPYTLTVKATNIFGLSDSDGKRFGGALPKADLWVDQEEIRAGDPVIIRWSTSNASSVRLDPFGLLNPNEFTGVREDRPPVSTIYTLTAINILGEPAIATATVKVISRSAPSVRLTVDPPVVTLGEDQFITLTWVATDADTITIEPGVGVFTPCDPNAEPGCNQRRVNAPVTDTVFTITGQNPTQTISEMVTVFVVNWADPIITEFNVTPSIVTRRVDQTITLTWNTNRADKVTLTPAIVGVVEPSGTRIINAPTSDTTYTLTAENGQGTSTFETVKVKVRELAPPEITFRVNPNTTNPNVMSITPEQVNTAETLNVVLEWEVNNVVDGDQVTITRGGEVIKEGKLSGSTVDKIPAIPDTSVTYVLTAKNRFNPPEVRELTVTVQKQ